MFIDTGDSIDGYVYYNFYMNIDSLGYIGFIYFDLTIMNVYIVDLGKISSDNISTDDVAVYNIYEHENYLYSIGVKKESDSIIRIKINYLNNSPRQYGRIISLTPNKLL